MSAKSVQDIEAAELALEIVEFRFILCVSRAAWFRLRLFNFFTNLFESRLKEKYLNAIN